MIERILLILQFTVTAILFVVFVPVFIIGSTMVAFYQASIGGKGLSYLGRELKNSVLDAVSMVGVAIYASYGMLHYVFIQPWKKK